MVTMEAREPDIIRLSKRVDPYHDGWTLIEFLCHRFRYLPRETWVSRIEAGQLRVDGAPAGADTLLAVEALVEYEVHVVEPDVDFAYDIIHDDDDILVVSKSGNIPVHAGGKYFRNTLIAKLREELGQDLALAHRLDRETSGVVVLTRTTEAARALAAAFAQGDVAKSYLAIVHGEPRDDEFVVDAPISRSRRGPTTEYPIARMVIDRVRGKPARTTFRVLERLDNPTRSEGPTTTAEAERHHGHSLVEARPETGRTHQVRLHLEFAGHPIVGDKIYGMPPDLLEESLASPDSEGFLRHLVLPRHALHARRLSLRHPGDGRLLTLEAPLPHDMSCFVATLCGRTLKAERDGT